MSRRLGAVVFVVYIIIGVIVAAGHHYFEHLDALKPIALAALAGMGDMGPDGEAVRLAADV